MRPNTFILIHCSLPYPSMIECKINASRGLTLPINYQYSRVTRYYNESRKVRFNHSYHNYLNSTPIHQHCTCRRKRTQDYSHNRPSRTWLALTIAWRIIQEYHGILIVRVYFEALILLVISVRFMFCRRERHPKFFLLLLFLLLILLSLSLSLSLSL